MKRLTRGSNDPDKFYNALDIVPPVEFSDHNSILLMPINHSKNSPTVCQSTPYC